MKRKLLTVVTLISVAISLVSCGNNDEYDVSDSSTSTVEKSTESSKASEVSNVEPVSIDGKDFMESVQVEMSDESKNLKSVISSWYGVYATDGDWVGEGAYFTSRLGTFCFQDGNYEHTVETTNFPYNQIELKEVEGDKVFELAIRDDLVIDGSMVTEVKYEKAQGLPDKYDPYPVVYFTTQDENGHIVNGTFRADVLSDGFIVCVYVDDYNWELGYKPQ